MIRKTFLMEREETQMKKLLSLLLALMMLVLPMAGLAEEDFEIYVDPTDTYGFAYPNDWTLLSKETIAEVLSSVEIEDEGFAALLQSLLPQIENTNMVMVLSPDLQSNINLVVTDLGGKLSASELMTQVPALQEMLKQQMPGIEFIDEAEIIETESYEYVLMGYVYELDGQSIVALQAFTSQGTSLYTFTLTLNINDTADTEGAENAFYLMLSSAELN